MTVKEFEIQYALGSMSYSMLMRLAGAHKTSKKILAMLSKDNASGVRRWVAFNSSTPEEILETLSKDKEHRVQDMAVKTLKDLRE